MLVLLSGLCTEMAETPVQEQQVVSFNQLIHERVWASQVEAPQRIEEIIPPPPSIFNLITKKGGAVLCSLAI